MPSSGINYVSRPCIYGQLLSSNTERKSRFMKWLNKIFKGCGTGRSKSRRFNGGGHHQHFLEDVNTIWRNPTSMDDRNSLSSEKEEAAHAMSPPSRMPNKREWLDDQDEYFERELADMGSIPSYLPYYPGPSYGAGYRPCGGCNRDIGYGNYLGCIGTYFHPECFRCHGCGFPINEYEFSLSGRDPYHKFCFRELTHPKCEVCYQFIPTNAAGLIEYRCHPFWSHKYCPSHDYDNTVRCCSCERLETRNSKYLALGDGRSLCLQCSESAIMDTGDCQPLYHSIRDYYEGMNMKLDQQIPMLLVERQALNEAIVGDRNGFHHIPETRGLCLSEEQAVTSIKSRTSTGGERLTATGTQNPKQVRKCEVTAILVLYGLPRLLTGAILAHELMHGWLRLKGYRNLNPEVEEGICQVMSYMWLESEATPSWTETGVSSSYSKKGRKSEAEKRLGEFFMHQIANDTSPAYGGGFRAANAAVNTYSLRCTLDHMRHTGCFPV